MNGLIFILIVLTLASLSALLILLLRKPQPNADVSVPLQQLTQAIHEGQYQIGLLTQRVAYLDPIPQAANDMRIELGRIAERVSTVEQHQGHVGQNVYALRGTLTETRTETHALLQTAQAIQSELAYARRNLAELQENARVRQQSEQKTAESIRHLEIVIAGTQSKGAAGENILEAIFAQLPAHWQMRNFTIGNRVVEFALRLPNDRILPIDSKWTATNLLEDFFACENIAQQQQIKRHIETTVLAKAKEVRKYLDPHYTLDFGIAAVPDAIFDLCAGIHGAIFQYNVVLVSYSMFLPYLLLVFQTVLKNSSVLDVEQLDSHVRATQENLAAIQDELEGRFSRAMTMLTNSRSDMTALVSKARGSLTTLQIAPTTTPFDVEIEPSYADD